MCSLPFAGINLAKETLCYFHETRANCVSPLRYQAPVCCASVPGVSALCACASPARVACSYSPVDGSYQASVSSKSSASPLLLLAMAALGLSDARAPLLLGALLLSTHVSADNWLEGARGRSPGNM